MPTEPDQPESDCQRVENIVRRVVHDCLSSGVVAAVIVSELDRAGVAGAMDVPHRCMHIIVGACGGAIEAVRDSLPVADGQVGEIVADAAQVLATTLATRPRVPTSSTLEALHSGIHEGREELEARLKTAFPTDAEQAEAMQKAMNIALQEVEALAEKLAELCSSDPMLPVAQGMYSAAVSMIGRLGALGGPGQMLVTSALSTCLSRLMLRQRDDIEIAEEISSALLHRIAKPSTD